MTADSVLVEHDPATGVRTLRLNRPDVLNAMDPAMSDRLERAIRDGQDDAGVRCIVVTGVGRAFCAGGDIAGWDGRSSVEAYAHLERRARLVEAVVSSAVPVIASINGPAIGGGFSLVLASDIAIASRSASFSQAFISMGLAPDMGSSYLLPRQVGARRARELVLTGRTVPAEEALELGIVAQVHDDDQLPAATAELAARLAARSPHAVTLSRRLLDAGFRSGLSAALHAEAAAYGVAVSTEEHRAAVRRFLDRSADRRESSL